MPRYLPQLALAGLAMQLMCLAVEPTQAASSTTFVSGKGADTGSCANPAKACRTLKYALSRTSSYGEIKLLDPASYGGATIKKSINIIGIPGASAKRMVIKASANDAINISKLSFDGGNTRNHGIQLKSGGSLDVSQCDFRNFVENGIFVRPTKGTTHVSISDVTASNNGGAGVYILMQEEAVVFATLDSVLMHANGSGFIANRFSNDADAWITINKSVASGNQNYGFLSGAQGDLRLVDSVSTDNAYGVFVNTQVRTAGNNFIYGNTTNNVAGSMTSVPLQ